jgi:hypothetical protein
MPKLPKNGQPNNKQTAEPTSEKNTETYVAATVTSGFGSRLDPYNFNKNENHQGVDLRAPVGKKIYSKGPGKVTEVNENPDNGKFIRIQYEDGRNADYLHLSDTSPVKKGDKVDVGTFIGKTGNTGRSKYPHLHFGVRDSQGKTVQPTQQEMEYTLNSPEIVDQNKKEMEVKKSSNTNVQNDNKNTKSATPTTVKNTQTNTASKVPDAMEDKIIELGLGDPGWFPFRNKLQRSYDGHWYREDGTRVKPEVERFAEEKMKSQNVHTQNKTEPQASNNNKGDTIDKSSIVNKNYKEEMFATSNDVSNSQTTIIMNKKVNNKQYAKVDDTNPYVQKQG